MDNSTKRIPWWLWIVMAVVLIPGLGYPFMGDLMTTGSLMLKGLTWFYPAYLIVSALLAWQCYGQRSLMSWIIIALMAMTDLCFYYLAFCVDLPNVYR